MAVSAFDPAPLRFSPSGARFDSGSGCLGSQAPSARCAAAQEFQGGLHSSFGFRIAAGLIQGFFFGLPGAIGKVVLDGTGHDGSGGVGCSRFRLLRLPAIASSIG